ncbi:uncharacterized protein BROUX77_001887 [Berkeleyomyces rouxiae]|uniref:uncharacterized protein n=1 Tax=Berkeleyomyces rouxiae TaxID=2035830 RepID=UPI003B80F857
MIPSFSGNSRRVRNVNMSGNNSAFSIWAPSSGFGASDAVSKAEEKRKRRQLDKKKTEAVQTVQRVWRGHRVRGLLRRSRQAEFDKIYSTAEHSTPQHRLCAAIPLISTSFKPNGTGEQRVLAVAHDIREVGSKAFAELIGSMQSRLLCDKIIDALKEYVPFQASTIDVRNLNDLLHALIVSASSAGVLLQPLLPKYYKLLIEIRDSISLGQETQHNWTVAIRVPLELSCSNAVDKGYLNSVYSAFSFSLLTYESTENTRNIIRSLAEIVDISILSSTIVGEFSKHKEYFQHDDRALWIIAHLILLGSEAGRGTTYGAFMDALLILVNAISSQLTQTITTKNSDLLDNVVESDSETEEDRVKVKQTIELPPYVEQQLESLTTQPAIEHLVKSFNLDTLQTPQDVASATSTIAGYMMCLFKCFPKRRDEISLRLFLSNISTAKGKVPLLQHLLGALLNTTLYRQVMSFELEPLVALKQYLDPASNNSVSETEWRIVLLTLDLYSFVLRLTDDDDFFARLMIPDTSLTSETPRIQQCNLSMAELSSLSRFLCQMSFPLYNNNAELEIEPNSDSPTYGTFTSRGKQPLWSSGESEIVKNQAAPNATLMKLDLPHLKVIITNALNMLYDRDSRRKFLPADHWLMKTKFNMSGFVTDVVIEHERQLAGEEEQEDIEQLFRPATTPFMRLGNNFYTNRSEMLSPQVQRDIQRRKTQRSRMKAIIGPRLEVLRHMPFVIPFDTRVELMRKFVKIDKMKTRKGRLDHENLRAALNNGADEGFIRGRDVQIQRQRLFESAFDGLWEVGAGIKNPLHIIFVDQFGATEAGIDGGGVTKEFLISVTSEAFGSSGLFTTNSQNQYYPDPSQYDWFLQKSKTSSTAEERQRCFEKLKRLLDRYEFLGRVVGKCIYEGILIDVSFAPFFLLKWIMGINGATGYKGNINDLRDLDEQTYQGLVMLKNVRDASEMELDFTVDDQAGIPGEAPVYITRNLIPNGDKLAVTNENRLLYTSYFSRHRLVVQSQKISTAFLRGLWDIIAPSWISMFSQWELQRLVGGDSAPVDLDDWRANTYYSGIYVIGDDNEEHPVIKMFWEVMHELDEEQRRQVLQYATSVPRAPLLGFSQLNPRFAIRDSQSTTHGDRLPSASTCMNLLKLPPYKSKEIMRQKLLYAIQSGAGFELS